MIVLAGDRPDVLPSASYVKHRLLGAGAKLHRHAQLWFDAPDARQRCRLHCAVAVHVDSAEPAGHWGSIHPSTRVVICPQAHTFLETSDDVDDHVPAIGDGCVTAREDCSSLSNVFPGGRPVQCRSGSSACTDLRHGTVGLYPTVLDVTDLERVLSTSRQGADAPWWADSPRNLLVTSPAGNGKLSHVRAVALSVQDRFHAVIDMVDVLSDRLRSPADALQHAVRMAIAVRPVVVSFTNLGLADRHDALLIAIRHLLVSVPVGVFIVGIVSNAAAGRLRRLFSMELSLPLPGDRNRSILQRVASGNALDRVSEATRGHTIADLVAICDRSATMGLPAAVSSVPPMSLADVVASVPDVRWQDIGGLADTIERLRELVQYPLENARQFERLGIVPIKGCILFGPSGTGKTLLAKAVATESSANFVSVPGLSSSNRLRLLTCSLQVTIPDLIKSEVGASETYLSATFRQAAQAAPCVLFFDEFQAMFGTRESSSSNTLVVQLLNEIDMSPPGVVILAATNRPDLIDPSLMRPGRFDQVVFVPPPDRDGRKAVVDRLRQRFTLARDVTSDWVAERTDGFTGADLCALVQKAGLHALENDLDAPAIGVDDFVAALRECRPSVTKQMIAELLNWQSSRRYVIFIP